MNLVITYASAAKSYVAILTDIDSVESDEDYLNLTSSHGRYFFLYKGLISVTYLPDTLDVAPSFNGEGLQIIGA